VGIHPKYEVVILSGRFPRDMYRMYVLYVLYVCMYCMYVCIVCMYVCMCVCAKWKLGSCRYGAIRGIMGVNGEDYQIVIFGIHIVIL